MSKEIQKFKSVVFLLDKINLIVKNLPKFIVCKSDCVVIVKDCIIETFSNELS